MRFAIGIDIGGTNTRVALVNEKYEIMERIQFQTIVEDPIANINKIKACIASFHQDVCGVGVSCPGPLDLKKGIVLTPPNLKMWHNFPIVDEMEKILGLRVYLENDANLACLAEALIGAGKNHEIVQFLTISTGVGAGLVLQKEIYGGAHGFAHEIANMIVWKNGPQLGDLKQGSIESIASGTAITMRARKVGLQVQHAGDVALLALQGQEAAKEIMEDAMEYLANAIAIMVALQDPDIIILSGSVALKIEGFVKEIEKRVKSKVYSNVIETVHIVPSALDEDCGLIGAAYLALTKKTAA